MDECKPHLAHFSREHVFIPADHSNFFIEEKSAGGEGKCYFSCTSECIVVKSVPAGPLIWSLKNGKIAEGSIITKDHQGYHFHLLEMKSKLTQAEWSKAKLQFEGMHLTTLAVARLLGISDVASVTCYIAFKKDALAADASADMILMKTFVGKPNPISGVDAWERETINLPFTGNATLRKAKRDADANADFGVIS